MKLQTFLVTVFMCFALTNCKPPGPTPIYNVTPSEFVGKSYVGYQAWFNIPNDRMGRGWAHWGWNNPLQASQMTFEMMPYTAEYPASALQDSGFVLGNGSPAKFFTGYDQGVINTHFRWMQEFEIDGAVVQWFTTDDTASRLSVLKMAKIAAELYGREFSVMFDFSGTKVGHSACTTGPQVVECLKAQWMSTVDAGITTSPRYTRVNGLPLVSVWGFGYSHNDNMTAQDTLNLLDWFHNSAPEKYRAVVLGGVTTYWRTMSTDPDLWVNAFSKFDILSPWMVAQSQDEATMATFIKNWVIPDLELVSKRNQKYLPVIFPGFSWYNLFKDQPQNQIPRRGGQFIWGQARQLSQLGIKSFYTAMFDEVNEGTAIMKTAANASEAPKEFFTLTLDADGSSYPNDWYLQVSRAIARALKQSKGFESASLPITPIL